MRDLVLRIGGRVIAHVADDNAGTVDRCHLVERNVYTRVRVLRADKK